MPRDTINTSLDISADIEIDESKEIMIKVDHVSMIFNMASEQLNSLKEYFITLAKGELRFKELRALNDVSFEVRKGDVFGILGTNGSGKSTMLKIVAGVLDPSEGSVEVKGNIAPLIELGAGFDMDLTARENVYLNGALLGYPKDFIAEHFDDIVDFAEVRDFLDIPLKNYSSGMVARIAFAIATIIVPDVLIVDEVLAVGDFMFQQKCEDRIKSLIQDYNVTVLIVSHNTDQVARLCNKAIWIERGNTRIMGDAKVVCDLYGILGGRNGDTASEEKILEAYQFNCELPQDLSTSFFGSDRYDTSFKIFNETSDEEIEAAVLATNNHHADCLIATSLAGHFGTSPLFLAEGEIPSLTALAVKNRRPQTIYVVGATQIDDAAFSAALGEFEYQPRIVRIETGEPDGFDAFAAGRFGTDAWSSTALVVAADDPTASIATLLLSPYLYTDHVPVYVARNEAFASRFAREKGRFTRLIIAGERAEELLPASETPGVERVSFAGTQTSELNALVNEWVTQEWKGEEFNTEEVVITSPQSVVDNDILGAFAGSKRALLVLQDPADLDSTAGAIDYLRNAQNVPQSMIYIGDVTRFNQTNRLILARASRMGNRA